MTTHFRAVGQLSDPTYSYLRLSQWCQTRLYGLLRWRCVETSLGHSNTLTKWTEFFGHGTGLRSSCRLLSKFHFRLSFVFPQLRNTLQQLLCHSDDIESVEALGYDSTIGAYGLPTLSKASLCNLSCCFTFRSSSKWLPSWSRLLEISAANFDRQLSLNSVNVIFRCSTLFLVSIKCPPRHSTDKSHIDT